MSPHQVVGSGAGARRLRALVHKAPWGRWIGRGGIARFVAWRIGGLALLLLILSFGVFLLQQAAPGSTEQVLLGTRPSTPEVLEAIRERYHLNESVFEQYGRWLGSVVSLDFGTSIRTGEPVVIAIQERFGVTLWIALYAFAVTLIVGVPLGILAAVRRRSYIDRTIVGVSVIGVSAPAFATSILLLYIFAIVLDWFPVFGQGEGFRDRLWHMTLPALALALTGIALIVKVTRAAMINALEQDYIRFARARGVATLRILRKYALRNALIPIVTAAGLVLGAMIVGSVLVEVTFALPGLGTLLVESVAAKDIPMIQGLAIVIAIVVVTVNLATDLLYLAIDPRIRFGRTAS